MAMRSAAAFRNACLDAGLALLNSGGTIAIYTGSQTGSVGGSESGNTLLATPTFSSTAFGASSSGTATANSITSATAVASGTAGHFLAKSAAAAVEFDGTCGQGTGDMSFDNSAIVSGGTVAISSMTVTMPQ